MVKLCDPTVIAIVVIVVILIFVFYKRHAKQSSVEKWSDRTETFTPTYKTDSEHVLFANQPNDLPIILIQQYYHPTDSTRAAEIDECLERNISCSDINKIILLDEQKETFPSFVTPRVRKLHEVVVGHRLTYYDFFDYVYKHPEPAIYVLANSDIYFTQSIGLLRHVDLTDRFGALLRWESLPEGIIQGENGDGSQDAWFIKSPLTFVPGDDLKFNLGKWGCDHVVASMLKEKGYTLVNPSHSVVTVHLHNSQFRTYAQEYTIKHPIYTLVPSTPILWELPVSMKGVVRTVESEKAPAVKVAIVSLSIDKHGSRSSFTKYTLPRHKSYASRHGYSYTNTADGLTVPIPGASPHWLKLVAMLRAMQNDVDVVMWIDDDATFTNPNVRVEDIIALAPPKQLYFSRDCVEEDSVTTYINTGVFILRNTELARQYLRDCIEWGYYHPHYLTKQNWEQNALNTVVMTTPKYLQAAVVFDPPEEETIGSVSRILQTFCTPGTKNAVRQWKPGDFILHTAGEPVETRERLFRQCFSEIEP